MKRPIPWQMSAAWLLCAAGCFQSAATPDAGTSDAAAGCSSLMPSPLAVVPTSTGTAPAPGATGGALVAGDYHLRSSDYYPSNACGVVDLATSLRVTLLSPTSGTIATVTTTTAGDSVNESLSFTSAGALLTFRLDCISPDPAGLSRTAAVIPYSASDGMIQLTTSSPACGTSVDTYVAD